MEQSVMKRKLDNRNDRTGYVRLDFSKLNFSDKILTFEEAMVNVEPIHWADDIINGKRKITLM